MNKKFDQSKTYKINPEIEDCEDTYRLSRFNTEKTKLESGGLYFHRLVDGKCEADSLSFFSNYQINDGELVEA